jgi:hypothetical protein
MVDTINIEYRPTSHRAPSGLLSLRMGQLSFSRMPSSGCNYYFHSLKTASKPHYGHRGGLEGKKKGIPRVM